MINRKMTMLVLGAFCLLTLLAANQIGDGFSNFEFIPEPDKNENITIQENTFKETENRPTDSTKENTIQVALLLDTSQSMDGLIEQAKSQLWNILNTMNNIQKGEEETSLEIALYEYGNPDKCKNDLFVSKLTDFTTDVDIISEKLFALSTDGGEEFCSAVINSSLEDLEWTNNDQLKMIFIAGNESFKQGPVSFQPVATKAKNKDVFVNTIFCGGDQNGRKLQWANGANAAGGNYMSMEQNAQTVFVTTPYDQEINDLNSRLNSTYIPYGRQGHIKRENQMKQDENAGKYGTSNMRNRAVYKSSKNYKADDWDLVDAYKKDKTILNNKELMEDDQANMSIEDLELLIENSSTERDSIKEEIQRLDEKRRRYQEEQKNIANTNNSLEQNILLTIQEQAKSKGYQLAQRN